MSITITSQDGQRLGVNAWNWGVLHFIVEKANLFPEDTWEPARYMGTDLTHEQAFQLADFLESKVLPCLEPGERLFFDGTKTHLPDDGTFYREPSDQWRNYSLHHEVLVSILSLLRNSRGAVSFY
ncbi:MAG: hypothetical protein H6970_13175 [Gammaproteobacteria bacterium]|nr:hypothetical protein [Gammaproteobacteria bacterium]MCP5458685.1 hypothetical protein [Gammaproteobacteria bacterium]